MKKLIGLIIILAAQQLSAQSCFQESEHIEFRGGGGVYHRVHPSGNYVMYTSKIDGKTGIADLSKTDSEGKVKPTEIKTKMTAETYPVEGRWELLAAPYNHPHGMSYFKFDDFTANPEKSLDVKPVFNDKSHDEYYHSTAELPGGTQDNYTMRTTLWSDRWTQDYTVKTGSDGKKIIEPKGKRYQVCENVFNPPVEGQPSQPQFDRAAAQARIQEIQRIYSSARTQDERRSLEEEYYRIHNQLNPGSNSRRSTLTQPILSKDGTMIAGIPSGKNSTHVYKIKDNGDCELVKDLGIRTSKVNFSYPENNKFPLITYTAEGNASNGYQAGVFVYDLNSNESKKVSNGYEAASYPGFTRDGRVIFKANTPDRKVGFARVDAKKIMSNGKECAEKPTTSNYNNEPYNPGNTQN